jgi:AraC-like DNA-binding protein
MSFSVSDLCSAIGITQPYLYRIFKEEVGCSPKNYISEYRIKLAKKLLAETEFSVSAIADSVGFKSVLDFSKFFSKRTGVSPTEYRKESR